MEGARTRNPGGAGRRQEGAAATTGSDEARGSRAVFATLLLVYAAVYLAKVVDLSVTVGPERYFVVSDDALISMRYAENLAKGNGLVWNAGDPPVEGYTNFLWVLWMGALHRLPLAKSLLPGALQLSILVLNLVTFCLLRRFALVVHADTRLPSAGSAAHVANVPVLLLVASSNFMGWSLSGLEVGLLALATMGAVSSSYQLAVRGDSRHGVALAAWATVGLLTRDDFGVVLASLGAAYVATEISRGGLRSALAAVRATVARHAPLLLLPAAAKSAHLLFRYLYYGDLLPNTYYAKVSNWALEAKLRAGAIYVLQEAYSLKVLLALVAAGCVCLWIRRRRSTQRWRSILGAEVFLLAVLAINAAYVVSVGGDAFPQGRFTVAFYGLLFLAAVIGALLLLERLRSRRRVVMLALLILLVAAGTPAIRAWRHGLAGIYVHDSWDARWNIEYAHFLRRLAPEARVAVFWAGGVPYWSELYAVDLLGLNDPVIARGEYRGSKRLPGHGKYDFEYSLGHYRPDFVVGFDVPEQLDPRSPAGADRLRELERIGRYPFVPALFISPSFVADYYDHVVPVPESIHVPGIRVFARGELTADQDPG